MENIETSFEKFIDIIFHPVFLTLFWSVVTIAMYLFSKYFYKRFSFWYLSPLAITPILVMIVVVALHSNYAQYIGATHWLIALLGPITVAFAIPIWQQRETIRHNWHILSIGVLVGSTTSMFSAWGIASLLNLDSSMRLSLMPRSMSTPFAMTVSGDIGGIPDLTAVFVVMTGVLGAALGEILLKYMPLRSSMARGALFGLGAHGAGVARARQIGHEEGSIAGLVMVMVGIVNVLLAPIIGWVLS